VGADLKAFLTPVKFYQRIGVGYRLGERLRKMKVLRPDALLDERPIFIASVESFELHRSRIRAYRSGLFFAKQNVQRRIAA
jgi:hypothetical protein